MIAAIENHQTVVSNLRVVIIEDLREIREFRPPEHADYHLTAQETELL